MLLILLCTWNNKECHVCTLSRSVPNCGQCVRKKHLLTVDQQDIIYSGIVFLSIHTAVVANVAMCVATVASRYVTVALSHRLVVS
jgi:hypothetical protein